VSKEDEEGAKEIPEAQISTGKQQGLFGSSGIELSEKELKSSATVKFLRHINSDNASELTKLKSFEGQFYDKRQEAEVLKKEIDSLEKQVDAKKEKENIQKAMIICGSLLLGSMKLISSAEWYVLTLLAVISVVLIVGGMFPFFKIGGSK